MGIKRDRDIRILTDLQVEREKKIEKRKEEIEEIRSDIMHLLDKIDDLEEEISMYRGAIEEKESMLPGIEEEIQLLENKIESGKKLIYIAETGELPPEEKSAKKLKVSAGLKPLTAFF